MGAAPSYKVYQDNEYLAAFWNLEDAAIFVSSKDANLTIRQGHSKRIYYRHEGDIFTDSLDDIVEICVDNLR